MYPAGCRLIVTPWVRHTHFSHFLSPVHSPDSHTIYDFHEKIASGFSLKRYSAMSTCCLLCPSTCLWVEPESGMGNPPSPQRGTTHTWRKSDDYGFSRTILAEDTALGRCPVSASGCLLCNVKSTLNRRSTLSEVPYGAPRCKESGFIGDRAAAWFPRIL